MDANSTRFWMLGDGAQFARLSHCRWDEGCRVLRLASERVIEPALPDDDARTVAAEAIEQVPRAMDALEAVAVWDAAESAVLVRSGLPGDLRLLPLATPPTDLAVTGLGVLLVATAEGVLLHDLRGRWDDEWVRLAGFVPWRLAPSAEGAWVLERGSGRLARLAGRPRRRESPQPDDYAPGVFRPAPENAAAPTLQLQPGPVLDAGEAVWALAAGPDEALVLLTRTSEVDGTSRLHGRDGGSGRWQPPWQPAGARFAYAVAWLAPQQVLLRVPGLPDAPAYDLSAADAAGLVMPLGRIHPLRAHGSEDGSDGTAALEAPFANVAFGLLPVPFAPAGARGARPLHPLSLNRLARRGEAEHFAGDDTDFRAWLIDSGRLDTTWHRLVAEADIPVNCGFTALLAATQEPRPPAPGARHAWHAHGFGADIAELDERLRDPQVPRACWERAASEVAGHPGLLGGERVRGRRGLFDVLIQNSRQRVRTLVGRYLWIRLVLHGDGRSTPEIAALRAWGSRFNYAEHYLPRLYRESLVGAAAEAPGHRLGDIDNQLAAELDAAASAGPGPWPAPLLEVLQPLGVAGSALAEVTVERPNRLWLLRDGPRAWRLALENPDDGPPRIGVYRPLASPADFNARLLANVEGVLTQLEDRIAAAHLLSQPQAVPEPHLAWLASWVGVAFDAALPASARREWLAAAPQLARAHGTRCGLALALDIATGGGVHEGRLVIVESFRLRRVLATLLGVDLDDERDPLLPGLNVSGNSVVGDTLVLGDTERAELVALFRDDDTTGVDDRIVADFHARLAHRALVLVHGEAGAELLGLVRRICRLEAPAHVDVQVAVATWPLMVGVASLVGVDTHLGPPRQPRPVRVQRSALGQGDFLVSPATLDPRLAGTPGPHALAAPPPA